jgi:D-3-phosphoglycerate dehydrogenase
MKVIGFDAFVPADRFPEGIEPRTESDDVFREADFLSLHIPGTKDNTDLVCERTLKLMKKDAILVNCARGEVLDMDALAAALQDGTIRAAALDVLKKEPPVHHPLFELENVLLTPHSAALTEEAMDRMSLHAAMGIHAVLSGEAPKWPVKL